MPQTSPSVLVIRLDGIGDALALTPLLAALRARAIPVDLVMRAVNAEIFSLQAARTVYVAPFSLRSSTLENRREIAAFGAQLRKRAYTHILIATEDPGGYRLARAIGARHRVGFINGWGKPFKTLWVSTMLSRAVVRTAGLDRRAAHECEVLWKLGAGLTGDAAIPKDPQVLRPLILEQDVTREKRVAFQISDKWERLGIGFDQVVRALRAAAELRPIHPIAAANESAYAQRIAAAASMEVECYTQLAPWKNAIAGAAALIAPDSGALHLAGMLGIPTVAVFPADRNFALQTARWSPWAAPHRLIRADANWPHAAAESLNELL